jgi:hypothetical protein
MADMYNAERLKEYCNWFFRRHASSFMVMDNDLSLRDDDE